MIEQIFLNIKQIKDVTIQRIGVTVQESQQRNRSLVTERLSSRMYFREKLDLKQECHKIRTSVSGILHSKFAEFAEQCQENQMSYLEAFLKNETVHLPCVSNVSIPEDLTNMSRSDLLEKIKVSIKGLLEPDHTFFKKSIALQKTTDDLVTFFEAVCHRLSVQSMLLYEEDDYME